jgi:hypothetical protein
VPATGPTAGHFFDASGVSQPSYEAAWPILEDFFGPALPRRIVVEHVAEGTSRFDPDHQVIVVSRATTVAQSELAVVAHETAHLALAVLTRGASTLEPLRFIDEGLAMIIQKEVEGKLEAYKAGAIAFAAGRLATGNVTLVDLQHWSTYFGVPPKADFDAYDVGAAFLCFIEDKYGRAQRATLLADLGRTRTLDVSLRNVFGSSVDETEVRWESYLHAAHVHVPAVTEMVPANGTTDVPVDLREIRVTFDTDMQPDICLSADCHGLCYDRARWLDARTLVVAADAPLRPAHDYSLSLGVPGRCRLKSRRGVEAPIVTWRFRIQESLTRPLE